MLVTGEFWRSQLQVNPLTLWQTDKFTAAHKPPSIAVAGEIANF